MPRLISNTIRLWEFLSACSPSCVTNTSDEPIRSKANELNCFLIVNLSIVFALPSSLGIIKLLETEVL